MIYFRLDAFDPSRIAIGAGVAMYCGDQQYADALFELAAAASRVVELAEVKAKMALHIQFAKETKRGHDICMLSGEAELAERTRRHCDPRPLPVTEERA